jgi:succinate dehydrogenase / fumarate reductase membrane anchor subunit
MRELSPRSRGRSRPRGGGAEVAIWYLIRLTGVGLFVLALAHFSVLHFLYDPADQTAQFIAEKRWSQLIVRVLDWMLLMMVLLHGFLGLRTVIVDYVRGVTARVIILSFTYLLAAFLFVIGTLVLVTLPSPGSR